jgi:hypothetical protein
MSLNMLIYSVTRTTCGTISQIQSGL